ncbi:hypothetical protein K432DRAFT_5032 [Lepidopterella palustris CBS 459.81]|uniref:Uncharacterized protein n=1 Tax=Lepidopterella palustris CBS 459.81 TaxID=1314670 RepID=A0A8E2J925_9PEZI|nr:hypothetical protein K432DRAFT_5032 [Lepidopterella palustris CBS 459.81]
MQSKVSVSTKLRVDLETFLSNASSFALPIPIFSGNIIPPPVVACSYFSRPDFRPCLPLLESVISPETPLYIVLKKDGSLIAITYVPNIAPQQLKAIFTDGRTTPVGGLGVRHFATSPICKDIRQGCRLASTGLERRARPGIHCNCGGARQGFVHGPRLQKK